MFDRANGLTNEMVDHIFRFFTPKELGRVASTSRLFNAHWQRINSLIKLLIKKANISDGAFNEFEKRCNLYVHQKVPKNSYYLKINTYDFHNSGLFSLNKLTDKSILKHDFIKKIMRLEDYGLSLYSPDGHDFYCMHSSGLASRGGEENYYYESFFTHESDSSQDRCQIYVDVDAGKASLLKSNFEFSRLEKLANDEDVIATYHLAQPMEKHIKLLQLLATESQLIPLQFMGKPEYLFKFPDQNKYIYITKPEIYVKNYKVMMGYANHWQEIPIINVRDVNCTHGLWKKDFKLDDSQSIIIHFSSEILSAILTWENDNRFEQLEVLNHREYDYASIGIMPESPNPRLTLLDSVASKEALHYTHQLNHLTR